MVAQGAKPGHGGILPQAKLTDLIREARGLPPEFDEDVNSPPAHSAFDTPAGLMRLVAQASSECPSTTILWRQLHCC